MFPPFMFHLTILLRHLQFAFCARLKSNPQSSNRSFGWPAVAQVAGDQSSISNFFFKKFVDLLIGNNYVWKKSVIILVAH